MNYVQITTMIRVVTEITKCGLSAQVGPESCIKIEESLSGFWEAALSLLCAIKSYTWIRGMWKIAKCSIANV